MTHHAAGGAAPGGIRQDCRPGVLPDAAPGITTTTTRTPEVPSMTDTHDDPSRYGCHPRHYLPPDLPDGWTLVATHNPPEPSGWWGACRVVLAERPGGDCATALVNPAGGLFRGRYDLAPLAAWRDFQSRCADEDYRAEQYGDGWGDA